MDGLMTSAVVETTPNPFVLVEPLKLDLGCGKSKRAGYTGVDSIKFDGVDIVADLKKRWPFNDDSVDEVHSSHMIEHLDRLERVHFWNELWRVLKVGAKASIIGPDWSNGRAYGDPTHKWPPLAGFCIWYLSKAWREHNSPHCDSRWVDWGYSCDFEAVSGTSWDVNHPEFLGRSDEARNYALRNFKDSAIDLVINVTKRAP